MRATVHASAPVFPSGNRYLEFKEQQKERWAYFRREVRGVGYTLSFTHRQ